MKRSVDLVIVAIVLTHAAICAGEPASQPARYKNIRQVDWKNFNYPTGPTTCDLGRDCGDEPLKVVNGTTEHSCASGSDLYLNPIEFGDVTGDDGEEAVVSFSVGLTNTGRMISTSCTFLYALRDELPIVVWAAGPLGVQSVHLGKRTFSFDVFRSRKESERHTYGGTPDFKLTLLKKEKVKAGSKPPSKEPDPQAQPASGPAVKTIRQVDWKNFTYPILPMDPKHCPGSEEASKPGSVTLKNGKNEKMGASFGKVVYVDVTGDKAEEAFVTVAVSELPDCLRGPLCVPFRTRRLKNDFC